MNQEHNELKVEIVNKRKNGLAIAALVLGIIGICLSFIPIVNNAAFVLGILSTVFGIIVLAKKRSLGKAITGIILGILAIVITVAMQSAMSKAIDESLDELDYMLGEKTEDILENSLDVKIGEFEVIEDEFWDESKLEVTLKNKSDKSASFDVTIEAVDKDGNRIDIDYIYVSNLGSGQSQKFDIFTLVTSDNYESMKKAKFRIVEVSMY